MIACWNVVGFGGEVSDGDWMGFSWSWVDEGGEWMGELEFDGWFLGFDDGMGGFMMIGLVPIRG